MSKNETGPAVGSARPAKHITTRTSSFSKSANKPQAVISQNSPIGDWQFELRLQEIIERAQRDADYLFHDLRGDKAFSRAAYRRPVKGRVAVRLDCKSLGERLVFDLTPENTVRLFAYARQLERFGDVCALPLCDDEGDAI